MLVMAETTCISEFCLRGEIPLPFSRDGVERGLRSGRMRAAVAGTSSGVRQLRRGTVSPPSPKEICSQRLIK